MTRLPSLLLLAVFALPVQASGQHLGLHVGAAITSLSVSDAEYKTGPAIGVSFDLPVSDNTGVRLGALYTEKGASFSEDGIEGGFTLSYIEFPAMLRFGGSVYGLAGAAVGINAGCSVELLGISIDCSDDDLGIETIDFGIAAGIGLSIRTSSSMRFSLEVLHSRGLSDVDDDEGKNRAFTAMAGITIDLGG